MFLDRKLGRAAAFVSIAASFLAGCQQSYHAPKTPAAQLEKNIAFVEWPSVHARVDPPVGWVAQPLKLDSRRAHQVWLSPSGDSAYGVIYFKLPIPVSADFILPFFMSAMKNTEGEAILVSKTIDPKLPGVRLEAEGGLYHIQANLMTAGFQGWAVYAGRLRAKPANEQELTLARAARERTILEVK
ncbi:MAG TPA: hypothetical protein VGG19_01550 [Tepidisphaeraceae bacterium]|jgi:hypothetical protein